MIDNLPIENGIYTDDVHGKQSNNNSNENFMLIKRQIIYDTLENKKYRFGALALIFPILYCIFDTIGTSFDGVILEGKHGLGLGENDVLVLYGLTFFVAGIGCWLFMLIRNKKPYNPFLNQL